MKIKIDYREKDFIKQTGQQIAFFPAFKNITFETENLALGDILICSDQDETLLIIERKTIPDLLSSLKDGRYEEQSYRLSGCDVVNHNIIYLIEGDANVKKHFMRTDKLTYYSTLLSLNIYKGFSVIKTQNLSESVSYICNCALKMQKNTLLMKTPYFSNKNKNNNNNKDKDKDTQSAINLNNCNDTVEIYDNDINIFEVSTGVDDNGSNNNKGDKDYISVVKKIKKDNITPNNIDEIMLCQIPSISSTIAQAFINKFGSIRNIISEYNIYLADAGEMPSREEVIKHLFSDIKYINSKGDNRRVSKTSMINIDKFILQEKSF